MRTYKTMFALILANIMHFQAFGMMPKTLSKRDQTDPKKRARYYDQVNAYFAEVDKFKLTEEVVQSKPKKRKVELTENAIISFKDVIYNVELTEVSHNEDPIISTTSYLDEDASVISYKKSGATKPYQVKAIFKNGKMLLFETLSDSDKQTIRMKDPSHQNQSTSFDPKNIYIAMDHEGKMQ